jgi:hypothetical protein
VRLPGMLFCLILISNAVVFFKKAIAADAELTGVVRDSSSGEPISGARIIAVGTRPEGGIISDSSVTGADGKFTLAGLKPDPRIGSQYTLSITADGYWTLDYPLVQVMPGETKRFEKDLFKVMSQTILIKEQGASGALHNARVTWRYRDARLTIRAAKSDAEGQAVLRGLVQSPSPLTVAAAGFRTRTFMDTLKGPGWSDTITVELEREAGDPSKSIVGTVFAYGQPKDRFPLFFTCASPMGEHLLDAEIQADGAFNLGGIPASCGEGTLFSNPGILFGEGGPSKSISLRDRVTRIDINLVDPPTGLRPEKKRPRSVSETRGMAGSGIRDGFNLLGRKHRGLGPVGFRGGDR